MLAANARLAESAVAEHPDRPALWRALGIALVNAGRHSDAVERLDFARARFPDDVDLVLAWAQAQAELGEIDASLAALLDREDDPRAASLAFDLLGRIGRGDEAARLEPIVAAADPADRSLIEALAKRHLPSDPAAMLEACEAALARSPGRSGAIYHKAVALALLGRAAEARETMGIHDFVHAAPLKTPAGFADEASFRTALAAEILANPTLHADPAGHATSKGLRTRTLPLPGDRATPALLASIGEAVCAYADGLAGDHPFVAGRPDRAALQAWALVFEGEGRQLAHRHPGGWMTGVYYVAAPEAPAHGGPRPGALRIGAPERSAGFDPPWPIVEIAPEPGLLVLFPSFVPHETISSGRDEKRISVAFDAIAVRGYAA
ncbi:MAG TPA: putative 2OG-Fe(II) oxygenase [Allosphingosinicella sp.]